MGKVDLDDDLRSFFLVSKGKRWIISNPILFHLSVSLGVMVVEQETSNVWTEKRRIDDLGVETPFTCVRCVMRKKELQHVMV